jgi:hypothetical protein
MSTVFINTSPRPEPHPVKPWVAPLVTDPFEMFGWRFSMLKRSAQLGLWRASRAGDQRLRFYTLLFADSGSGEGIHRSGWENCRDHEFAQFGMRETTEESASEAFTAQCARLPELSAPVKP